jgi:DNA-binding CsgD family transcriptional regulator
VDEFLKQLAGRLQVYDSEVISADEMVDWPDGKLDELVSAGILTEIGHSKGVVCDQCEENCYIEPTIRTYQQNGKTKTIGVFVCTRNPDIGRFIVDLDRLRQWRISVEKLEHLGYTKKKSKKRNIKVSSDLTPKETEVFTLIHVNKKTQQQAAIEMRCTPQNVSKLLKKAEAKMKARNSRSINLSKAQKLPEDKRGQTSISNKDI